MSKRVTVIKTNDGRQFKLKGWRGGRTLNALLKKVLVKYCKPSWCHGNGRSGIDCSWGINTDGSGAPFTAEVWFTKGDNTSFQVKGKMIVSTEDNPVFTVV